MAEKIEVSVNRPIKSNQIHAIPDNSNIFLSHLNFKPTILAMSETTKARAPTTKSTKLPVSQLAEEFKTITNNSLKHSRIFSLSFFNFKKAHDVDYRDTDRLRTKLLEQLETSHLYTH